MQSSATKPAQGKLAQNLANLMTLEFQPPGTTVSSDMSFPKSQEDFDDLNACQGYAIANTVWRIEQGKPYKTCGLELSLQNGQKILLGKKG